MGQRIGPSSNTNTQMEYGKHFHFSEHGNVRNAMIQTIPSWWTTVLTPATVDVKNKILFEPMEISF